MLGLGLIAGGNLLADRTPVSGDVSNIRHVSFQRTPNLYFVSFDSIIPRSLLRKHLGVETTGFHELFEKKMRRFPNFFSDSFSTKTSLNMLLALEASVYYSQREKLEKKGRGLEPQLFSGQSPSPLLDILRRNGYETTSIYANTFFGKYKGHYIDNYLVLRNNTVCKKLHDSLRNISFWGYCRWFVKRPRNSRLWTVEEIAKVRANDGPQFVITHFWSPGHTLRPFRYGDVEQFEKFKDWYIAKCEEAVRYLESIVRHLEENDPEAILLVYGDHGPYLSRGLKFEDDPTFVVQDHFGVIGGVWPRDACAVELDEASAKGWMTTLEAVHAILRCLSGGESALVEPRKRQFSRYGRYGSVPEGVDPNYEDFLYE